MLRSSICLLVVVCMMLSLLVVADSSPMIGFTTFFTASSCPKGWKELSVAQGRLLVSVDDASNAGVTVNTPLADREDRQHEHSYNTTLAVAEKDVAAAKFGDTEAGAAGDYPLSGSSLSSDSGYPFSQLLLCTYFGGSGSGSGESSNSSGGEMSVAFGSIGFFNPDISGCPSGWNSFEEADGRILVPGYERGGTVRNGAQPLSSGEDRKHNHSYSTDFSLSEMSFEGIAGCCDHSPAKAQTVAVAGVSDSSSSGLPYIQLLTCVSEEETFNMTGIPTDALVFNELACPEGWEPMNEVAGRMLVALPEDGLPGASFGAGANLPDPNKKNHEPVDHRHIINGTFTLPSSETGLVSGCCAHGYGKAKEYSYSAPSKDAAVDLPYLMAPLCQYVGTAGRS